MGHCVQIILGTRAVAGSLAGRWVHAKVCPLPQGFAAIPLTAELSDDIQELMGSDASVEPFEFFTSAHQELLVQASHRAKLAYLETDYFGGTGSQCVALFENGRLILGPLRSENLWDEQLQVYRRVPEDERAINAVLRAMGVWTRPGSDEFDALELGKYRRNEAFFR